MEVPDRDLLSFEGLIRCFPFGIASLVSYLSNNRAGGDVVGMGRNNENNLRVQHLQRLHLYFKLGTVNSLSRKRYSAAESHSGGLKWVLKAYSVLYSPLPITLFPFIPRVIDVYHPARPKNRILHVTRTTTECPPHKAGQLLLHFEPYPPRSRNQCVESSIFSSTLQPRAAPKRRPF